MDILAVQETLQRDTYLLDFREMGNEERIVQVKEMKLALEAELQEMLDEVGWKPWASSRFVNAEAMRGELIDALHFLLNLMILAGFRDWEEVEAAYLKKRNINAQRQEDGYDGVSGKCPACRRALDDGATRCKILGDSIVCQEYGPVRIVK